MTIGFSEFLSQLAHNPALAVTVVLTLGVILVNGWTDAPNAIATCVSTRSIEPARAILMAAVFNFLGRAGHDADQRHRGHDHLQHGGLRGRLSPGAASPCARPCSPL